MPVFDCRGLPPPGSELRPGREPPSVTAPPDGLSREHSVGLEVADVAVSQVAANTTAGDGAQTEHPSTPRKSCKNHLKQPRIGMIFDTLRNVEDFYKSSAHDAGFSVRIGQQKKQNEEILIKRYLCSREGYKKEDEKNVTNASGNKRSKGPIM